MRPEMNVIPLVSLTHGRVTFARANWGRWIADCPGDYCASALQLQPGELFRCYDCPTIAEVVWPDDKDTIEALLMLRPDPRTRNWALPETTTDLMFQNSVHGINASVDALDGSTTGRLILDADTLGVVLLPEPLQIEQGVRPQIGA